MGWADREGVQCTRVHWWCLHGGGVGQREGCCVPAGGCRVLVVCNFLCSSHKLHTNSGSALGQASCQRSVPPFLLLLLLAHRPTMGPAPECPHLAVLKRPWIPSPQHLGSVVFSSNAPFESRAPRQLLLCCLHSQPISRLHLGLGHAETQAHGPAGLRQQHAFSRQSAGQKHLSSHFKGRSLVLTSAGGQAGAAVAAGGQLAFCQGSSAAIQPSHHSV